LWCNKTSLNQEKSEFEKTVEKHELEMITKRQELRQIQEDIERQKVIVHYKQSIVKQPCTIASIFDALFMHVFVRCL